MKHLPDVQASSPEIPLNLTRVGVRNVKKLVELARKGGKRPIVLVSTFDIFVDLPSSMKGANLSRNFEAMYEVLESAVNTPFYEIEELCVEVAKRLLQRHKYASVAEVRMRSEFIAKRKTPVTAMECQEPVVIFAEAKAFREGRGISSGSEATKDAERAEEGEELEGVVIRKRIGAEVVGVTTCPCAQELMKELAREALKKQGRSEREIEEILSVVPIATHNQRGRGIISIEVEGKYKIPLEKIIGIIGESMSARTYELLKRPDEAFVTMKAHRNPKFAEDCVREMALRVVENFKELPDDAVVRIIQINEESIHQHEAVAERIAMLGELRRELGCNSEEAGSLAATAGCTEKEKRQKDVRN